MSYFVFISLMMTYILYSVPIYHVLIPSSIWIHYAFLPSLFPARSCRTCIIYYHLTLPYSIRSFLLDGFLSLFPLDNAFLISFFSALSNLIYFAISCMILHYFLRLLYCSITLYFLRSKLIKISLFPIFVHPTIRLCFTSLYIVWFSLYFSDCASCTLTSHSDCYLTNIRITFLFFYSYLFLPSSSFISLRLLWHSLCSNIFFVLRLISD